MDITVYDAEGDKRDLAYLKSKYGDFIIKAAAGGEGYVFKISTLREKVSTAASIVVRVIDADGAPLEGIRVAFYWPDADVDPNAGPLGGVLSQMQPNRCMSGPTNPNGDVGFGMGPGAYYWVNQDEIGPHAVWIHGATTRSDVILGLGMLAGTNHDHFEVEYTRLEKEDGEELEKPAREEILAKLAEIEASAGEIQTLLAKTEAAAQKIRTLLDEI